jgi:hypothetical protein
MAIKEVRSPISSTSRSAGGPGSVQSQPLSSGARSHPSARARGDQAPSEHPAEPQAHISLGGGDERAEVRVTDRAPLALCQAKLRPA